MKLMDENRLEDFCKRFETNQNRILTEINYLPAIVTQNYEIIQELKGIKEDANSLKSATQDIKEDTQWTRYNTEILIKEISKLNSELSLVRKMENRIEVLERNQEFAR